MAKLTALEKDLFNCAVEEFDAMGMHVVSIKTMGLTIGISYTNSRMHSHVRVYVTQCGENDKFKFKRGIISLLNKRDNDNFIVVPVLGRTITEILDGIVEMYSCGMYGIYDVQCRYL